MLYRGIKGYRDTQSGVPKLNETGSSTKSERISQCGSIFKLLQNEWTSIHCRSTRAIHMVCPNPVIHRVNLTVALLLHVGS